MEKENNNEKLTIKNSSEFQTLEEANSSLDNMLEAAFRDKGTEAFEQIENGVGILDDLELSSDVRNLIITKLIEDFYPIAKVSGEVIKTRSITKVANTLGKIIIENAENKEFKNKCKRAFIETITLNEKTI